MFGTDPRAPALVGAAPEVVGDLRQPSQRVGQDVVEDVRVGRVGPDHVGVQVIDSGGHVERDRSGRLRAIRRNRQRRIRRRDVLSHGRVQLCGGSELAQLRGDRRRLVRRVVDAERRWDVGAAVATDIHLRRRRQQTRRLCSARHRRERHLLGGEHRLVDVDLTGSLLARGGVDVAGRPVEDLLDHRGSRALAVVRVGVRLDHVRGGSGDERRRLAGASERLGQSVRRAPGCDQRAAGGLAAIAGGDQVDEPARAVGQRERLTHTGR